jgi:hypothetical protein
MEKSPIYPLYWRLGGPQIRPGHTGFIGPAGNRTQIPPPSIPYPVIIPTDKDTEAVLNGSNNGVLPLILLNVQEFLPIFRCCETQRSISASSGAGWFLSYFRYKALLPIAGRQNYVSFDYTSHSVRIYSQRENTIIKSDVTLFMPYLKLVH